MNLNQKPICVITGAANGIGKALALLFLQKNYQVIGLELNVPEKLKSDIIWFSCDVTNENKLRTTAHEIKQKYGSPKVWINNAGIVHLGEFTSLDSKIFDDILRVNLNGVIYGCRSALQIMDPKNSGTIVNMSSASGKVAFPYFSAYVASKFAVTGFTRSLQMELEFAQSKVKTLSVHPGFVDTQMIHQSNQFTVPKWCMPTVGTPESVAKEIWNGIERGSTEITPTLNGKLLLAMTKIVPFSAHIIAKLLLKKS